MEIEKDLNDLNEEIANILRSKDEQMQEVVDWAVGVKGKQLRPRMLVWISRYKKNVRNKKAILYGAALEIIHIASLVHDDVIDEADMRRGRESVQAKFGKKMAVYAGDYMIFSVFDRFYRESDLKFAYIIGSLNDVCYGELGQNKNLYNLKISSEQYLQNIYGKTGVAFELACKTGATVGGLKSKEIELFSAYGKSFGILFQIRDDLLDYQDSNTEKTAFNDFVSGVYTLPLILAAKNEDAEKEILAVRESLEAGKTEAPEARDSIIAILRKYPWHDEFMEIADSYYNTARESLDALNASETVDYLRGLIEKGKADIDAFSAALL